MSFDLLGKRFNRYLITGKGSVSGEYKCLCDCGVVKSVRIGHLKSGRIKSCGCLRQEQKTLQRTGVEGKVTGTHLHIKWSGMKGRCYCKNHSSYSAYGGRGITICDEWLDSYSNFKEWAENSGYFEDASIDRIDEDKGYYPDNCQWLTLEENSAKMMNSNYLRGIGQFSQKAKDKRKSGNRKNLGRKFILVTVEGEEIEFDCLIKGAEYIIESRGLSTIPMSIKKNISACLSGKRKRCHGFTFKEIEPKGGKL